MDAVREDMAVVEVTGRMHKIGNEQNEWWFESPLWRPLT